MPAPTDRLPDVRSLIYEIERLRCAAMEMRESAIDVMNRAWEDGAREERQNVVAWLQGPIDGVIEEACVIAAAAIERGEHVKGRDE
jgi:hypothetical protein